jgi:hypothetical protein
MLNPFHPSLPFPASPPDQLRAAIECNHSSVHAYAVLPSPIVVQNKSLGSDIYVEGMYAPDARGGGRAAR